MTEEEGHSLNPIYLDPQIMARVNKSLSCETCGKVFCVHEKDFDLGNFCYDCGHDFDEETLDDYKQRILDTIERKKKWHEGECRKLPDCSICLFLKELPKELGLD